VRCRTVSGPAISWKALLVTTQEQRPTKRILDAAKLPAADPIPHPALDLPVEEAASRPGGLDRIVFGVTAAIAIAFLVWGFVSTSSLATASGDALTWVMEDAGWLFVLTASAIVVFVIWLAASRYGDIPLGRDDETPEFRTVSWVAMMFSAGMGIGLMFYGVGEPISHFTTAPPGTGEAGSVQTAMATTLFHWTLHPWAIYAVVGLAIAYGTYRKGRVQLISAAFEPLLGKRVNGGWGRVIDMLAIFATLFGSAASLGLGALQIGTGLEIVTSIGTVGNAVLIAIIAVLTVAFILSAVSGVARGIQWLSNINMVLALALALFIFVGGPTIFMLNLVPTSPSQPLNFSPLPICSAPSPSEAAEPKRVAKMARMSISLPIGPSVRLPSSGPNAAEISWERPLRKVP